MKEFLDLFWPSMPLPEWQLRVFAVAPDRPDLRDIAPSKLLPFCSCTAIAYPPFIYFSLIIAFDQSSSGFRIAQSPEVLPGCSV
jgi:hypothetical protein